jgi:predicted flap endonuclease-1-like 5' DNA nuclease
MDQLIILLIQTKGVATIEIILLLLVAAIIGYVTAWFYTKSIYDKKIKIIEEETNSLKTKILEHKEERSNLNRILLEKNTETEHLFLEVKALKALHAEAVHELDDMKLNNIRLEQQLYEKDEALFNITQRGLLLDYNSFGVATEAEKDDLQMISGIGPFIEERLHALDIYTFLQISKFSEKDIETINNAIEYFSGRVERDEWVAQARELVRSEERRTELFKRIEDRKTFIYYDRIGIAHKEIADNLTLINGIGGWMQEKLNMADIYTFLQISNFTEKDVETVAEAIEYLPERIERDEWIPQAQELVRITGKKSELLKRIRERKNSIYFDRLGIAHKYHANNLTLINGIGLWIEEKLNTLNIFTFVQISKLIKADIDTITEILELAPGRIERDKWVAQADELAKKSILKK